MKNKIFRKVSLDRLSSPEALDQLMTVTTPRAWISLIAIGAILFSAIIWGFFGNIPIKTYGEGILISSDGVYNIVHSYSGEVTDVSVSPGNYISKGDVIARINKYDLVEKINSLKEQLSILKNLENNTNDFISARIGESLYNQIYGLLKRIKDAEANLNIYIADYTNNKSEYAVELKKAILRLETAQLRSKTAREEKEKVEKLFKNGAVSQQELSDAINDLKLKELEVDVAKKTVKDLENNRDMDTYGTKSASVEQARLTVKLLKEELADIKAIKIEQLKNEITNLQNELELKSNVVSQVNGRVMEVNINKGDILYPDNTIANVVRGDQNSNDLEVIMYVPAEEGKRILPGMDVQISPTIVKKEEFGFMLGKVVSVSGYPSSKKSIINTLGNQELASRLAGRSAPIEVHIDLITDEDTQSGYKWSTPKGPPIKVDSGTISTGSIIVKKQRPISMVIPFIKKILPI
ncbi:MAG: NHLP bacteriocin system secretion protein [Bacillota bacterium]